VARLAAAAPLVHAADVLHSSWMPALITATAALAIGAWLWRVARAPARALE